MLRAQAKINNIAPKMGPIKPTAGRLAFTISGWAPQDVKAFGGGKRIRMIMHVEGLLKRGGQAIKFVMDFDQSAEDMTVLIK